VAGLFRALSVLLRLDKEIGKQYLWCVFGVELYCDFSHGRYEHHVLRHDCVLIVGESGRVNWRTEWLIYVSRKVGYNVV
jgi:hypothetical protein